MTKFCIRCEQDKAIHDFQKRQASVDGLHYWCKPCFSQYKRDRLVSKNPLAKKYNTEKPETGSFRICTRCVEKLPEHQMVKNHSWCKRCQADSKHNLSVEQRNVMLFDQYNSCAGPGCDFEFEIRGGKDKTYSIDHDHSCCSGTASCGKCIRGLLCTGCNKFALSVAQHLAWLDYCTKYEKAKI